MKLSYNATKLEIEMLRKNKERKPLEKILLKMGIALLATNIVVGSTNCSHEKTEVSISQIAELVRQKADGREVNIRERKGFCAVHCKKDGEGPFSSNKTVYEVDFSTSGLYHKEFYSKDGFLLVEGIGNESERWFRNPNWKGKTVLVRALKTGSIWYPTEDYMDKEAEALWAKIKADY